METRILVARQHALCQSVAVPDFFGCGMQSYTNGRGHEELRASVKSCSTAGVPAGAATRVSVGWRIEQCRQQMPSRVAVKKLMPL